MSSSKPAIMLVLLTVVRPAPADLIEVDWGDHPGGLTVDTLTGLEWLDPFITRDRSYDATESLSDPGEELERFRHATTGEMETFFGHLGLPYEPSSERVLAASRFGPLDAMRILVDHRATFSTPPFQVDGYFNDAGGRKVGRAFIEQSGLGGTIVSHDDRFSIEHNSHTGNWLVRETLGGSDLLSPLWHIADSNRDGSFDQHDLIAALQAGLYLSGMHGASRTTGDWNGDGFFDQLDVVRVLQAGGYETSSSRALTIPEPATIGLAWFALLALVMYLTRRTEFLGLDGQPLANSAARDIGSTVG